MLEMFLQFQAFFCMYISNLLFLLSLFKYLGYKYDCRLEPKSNLFLIYFIRIKHYSNQFIITIITLFIIIITNIQLMIQLKDKFECVQF